MRKIAVEEHFATNDYLNYLRSRKDFPKREMVEDSNHRSVEQTCYTDECRIMVTRPNADAELTNLDEGRLKDMDKAGIDMQVLSLRNTGIEWFDTSDAIEWAKRTNDELAAAVKRHPKRFLGLASLPFQDPHAAVEELDRAITQLGLSGAVVNSHVRGEYLDDRKFWPVFEKAEKLSVPVYIHPREPSPGMLQPFLAYPRLWDAMWGYGAEVGLHSVRLICSGVFDEYPKLKIVIGHMGEALPFWLWRLDDMWRNTPMAKQLHKKPSEYMKDNFMVSTSGLFSIPALLCAYLTLGADNIMFAVDYPGTGAIEAGVQFMDSAPISDIDKEKIYHANAEKLFHL